MNNWTKSFQNKNYYEQIQKVLKIPKQYPKISLKRILYISDYKKELFYFYKAGQFSNFFLFWNFRFFAVDSIQQMVPLFFKNFTIKIKFVVKQPDLNSLKSLQKYVFLFRMKY
jgi:hypothetical protein